MLGRMLAVLLLIPLCGAARAQTPAPQYVQQDVMVPMRDGVRLHAVVLRPSPGTAHADESLPILLSRTPYGAASTTPAKFVTNYPEFAAAGYIFVREDIRGRYGSEGSFVMMRPLAARHDPKLYPREIDESTDAYDTAGWLVEHLPDNNGLVGVLGVSYDGFWRRWPGSTRTLLSRLFLPRPP